MEERKMPELSDDPAIHSLRKEALPESREG
jgi:hypothetical protein